MPKKRIRKKYRYRAGGEVNGLPPIPFDVVSALSNEERVRKNIIRDLKRDGVKSALEFVQEEMPAPFDESALAGGLGSLGSKNRVPDEDRAGDIAQLEEAIKLLGSGRASGGRIGYQRGGALSLEKVRELGDRLGKRSNIPGYQKGGGILSRIARIRKRRKERAQELEDILAANPDRHLWPQYETPDRGMPYSGTADMPFLKALKIERAREGRFSFPSFMQARTERRGRQQADRPISLEDYRGEDWETGIEHEGKWYREGLQAGGIIGLQAGGWGGAGGGGGWGAGGGGGGMGGGQGFVANTPQGPGFGQAPDFGSPGSQPWGGGGGMGGPPGGGAGAPPGGGWGSAVGAPAGGGPPGGMGGPPGAGPVGAQYQPPTAGGPGYQPQALPENYGAPQRFAGYGGPAEMQVRQEFVSPEVAQQYSDLTQGIMQAGTRPYEQYQGPRLAGMTGMEAAAQAGFGTYGTGQGPQAVRQAEATLGEAAGGFGQIAAGGAKPELEREADLSQYMSQYTKGVVDPQLRQLQEFQKEQAQELGSQAAGAGAFGGYRQAIQQGQQAQAASQQAADIIGKGQQQAFQSAQQAFERDRAAKQAGVGQQISAYGQLAGIGGRQGQLGGEQQRQQMERLRTMEQAGERQRRLQQAGLDVGYEEFQKQQQYPQQQISWMGQQLGALPYQNIVQSGTYAPQAGPIGSTLEGITGASGAWEDYRAGQRDRRAAANPEAEWAARYGKQVIGQRPVGQRVDLPQTPIQEANIGRIDPRTGREGRIGQRVGLPQTPIQAPDIGRIDPRTGRPVRRP